MLNLIIKWACVWILAIIYDGGYDIVNDLDGVLDEFDRIIGLDRLKAIHMNDSKNPLQVI